LTPYSRSAALLQEQQDRKGVNLKDSAEDVDFCFQSDAINAFFFTRCHHFMESRKRQFGLELLLNSVEVNEVNIFYLLRSTAMHAIIEYTNKSLVSKVLVTLSYGEF
jgi:hypothetical protein